MSYFGNFEAAEKIYTEIDRKDLAIDLRVRLGDWFRVVQLIKSGGGGDDKLLDRSWKEIGDYYFDRQRWSQAVTYYSQGRNVEKLIECYYILEDYENLEKQISSINESPRLLKNVANKFVSVGMCEQAVSAFIKAGDVKSAVDICVKLNQWNLAIELAEIHNFKEIEGLLSKYANHLLQSDKKLEAVELYKKANLCQLSAQLLFELAEDAVKQGKPPMLIKKIYVLGALEVERYHNLTRVVKGTNGNATAALDGLLTEDVKNVMNTRFLDNAWRGAEAYHFYLLAQRQLYTGNFLGAVQTALHLREYEDMINPKIIFSLLALLSLHSKSYGVCSKAFIKLEFLEEPDGTSTCEDLAMSILSQYPPIDSQINEVPCAGCGQLLDDRETYCSHCHLNFPTCIASGRPIMETIHFMCQVCKHRAIGSEISGMMCCPLCHTIL
ncbi:WD repeat-containing protein 35 [Nowakowskiella sp. JEL0407]|nr:WD repeat-containing protein 35 [Nowakowskiella sp. JEL0407]